MTRFHVRAGAAAGGRVVFEPAEARHIARVLRLGPGAVVEAFDGAGGVLTVRLERVGPRGAEGLVLSREARSAESPCRLTLCQGIAKGDKMDGIVRMATELGATLVIPLITSRVVVKVEPGRAGPRQARWQRVATEAAKQCGRGLVPEVLPPQPLSAWLAARTRGLTVCLWEEAREPLAPLLPPPPQPSASLVVGPEGGLAADEVEALARAGAVVGGLGPRVLRTETAGPVGLALLQSRYGDLGAGER